MIGIPIKGYQPGALALLKQDGEAISWLKKRDCFAALAMTYLGIALLSDISLWSGYLYCS
jgi:hypothetical protein